MSQSIAGKVVLVTGASSGIGKAIARLFAAEGAELALAARSTDRMQALADEIGGEPHIVSADLTDPAEVDRMVADTEGRFGQIDVLVANAGIYVPGLAAEGDPNAWDRMIALNVNSVFRASPCRPSRHDRPARRRHPGDELDLRPPGDPWEPVYSATKHAVQSFVHGVRRQVAEHGIRVMSLAPGMVLNELWGFTEREKIDERVAARAGLRSEDVAEACLFMLTRPLHVTIRDLVILPQNQDL